MIALLLAFAGAIGALAQDERVSEVRKVDDFSSIRINAVANVEFTQGDKYALRLEGKERWVKLTTTEVKDGCLVIDFKRGEQKSIKKMDGLSNFFGVQISPDLASVKNVGGRKDVSLIGDRLDLVFLGKGENMLSYCCSRNGKLFCQCFFDF